MTTARKSDLYAETGDPAVKYTVHDGDKWLGYEVDSLIEMPDDNKVIRHGPVFETRRDAEWYEGIAEAEHIPSWVVPVDFQEA